MAKIAFLENNVTSIISMRKKLILELQKTGYEIIIFTTGNEENIQIANSMGMKVIDIGSSKMNPMYILKYMINLRSEFIKFKPEVCLTFTIRPAIWGNVVTRLLGIPTITTIAGIGPLFEKKSIAYSFARLLYKFVLSKTAKIFFQNDDDMQLFLQNKFATAERVVAVPGSGVDYQYFSPIEKTTNDNKFKFLFISRLVKDKGIMEFLECTELLRKEFDNLEFTVIGPFWSQNLKANTVSESELQRWIDNGNIHYLGEKKDVRPFIANADCIVLPSYREGTSNVLLESCSMERPCITSNVTGCKEAVEDKYNGYLCEPRNVTSLYEAMKKMVLLPESERIAMGKRGRQKMIKEFDKQIVINAYLKAIEECIAKKPA